MKESKGPIARVIGVTKRFRSRGGAETVALSEVNLCIEEGEFLALLGPSGCGKTTLLRLLSGLEKPSSGSITMLGKPLVRPSNDASLVFQNPVLLPWRTILDNILLPAEVRGLRKADWRLRAAELMKMAGIDDFLHHRPRELSGGMKQRAAICRALLLDPSILFMDEPFGALDAITRATMNQELHSIWRKTGKTIVFVTHDITEAVRLATRIVVMSARPGRIQSVTESKLSRTSYSNRLADPEFHEYISALEGEVGALENLKQDVVDG